MISNFQAFIGGALLVAFPALLIAMLVARSAASAQVTDGRGLGMLNNALSVILACGVAVGIVVALCLLVKAGML